MKWIILLLVLAVLIAGCKEDIVIGEYDETKSINTPEQAIEQYELSIRTLNSELYLTSITSGMRQTLEKNICNQWKSKELCISGCADSGVFDSCQELCGEKCSDYVGNRIINELSGTDISMEFKIKDVKIEGVKAEADVELYSQDNKQTTNVKIILIKEGLEWKVNHDWIVVSQ